MIDWDPGLQDSFFSILARYQMDFPAHADRGFHTGNGMFERLDAWILQAVLRHLAPRRVIEVGCGWSSLVIDQVNREHLGGELQLVCIDPSPPDFMKHISADILPKRVEDQEVSPSLFTMLEHDDVLFIDSSHIVKTGGDVVYLIQDVLPVLAPGVLVHFHDIFLPWDYPEIFVQQGRGYTEQYLVDAFLSFNRAFQVLLGSCWMIKNRPDLLASVIPGYPDSCPDGGASLWIRRRLT